MKAKAAEQKFLTEQCVRDYLGKVQTPACRDVVQQASSIYGGIRPKPTKEHPQGEIVGNVLQSTTAHARVVVEMLQALGISYRAQNKVARELVGQMRESRFQFGVGKNHRADTPTGTERRADLPRKIKKELAQINGMKWWNTVGPGSQIK